MRQSKFAEEQMVSIIQESDRVQYLRWRSATL